MEPTDLGGLDKSPFVMIFSQLGIGWAAHLLNFIILTAALSVYNSGMYANSRMLYRLAVQGNAPKVFAKVSKQGVPTAAVIFSSILIFGCVFTQLLCTRRSFKPSYVYGCCSFGFELGNY